MIRNLNRLFFCNSQNNQGRRDCKGQIGVVIVLVIAVIFIFFAVILNLGRVSQYKNITLIAAHTSAAMMASEMIGPAEQLYQVVLGANQGAEDDLSKCGWTATASIIFGVIVSAVLIAVAPQAIQLIAMKLVPLSATLTGATLLSQAAVIQPGFNELWNKQQLRLDFPWQFAERGLSGALQLVVTDSKEISDTTDMDMDGRYAAQGDQVGRFAQHYSERMARFSNDANRVVDKYVVEKFLEELKELLYQGMDNWGIWDPIPNPFGESCILDPNSHPCCFYFSGPIAKTIPSKCNWCCLPNGLDIHGNINGEPILRFECCDSPVLAEYCGTATSCPFEPSGDIKYNFPYVFDPNFENQENPFISFREFLGRDDENKFLKTTWNLDGSLKKKPLVDDIDYEHDLLEDFRKEDSTGIYPVLWNISDDTQLGEKNCVWCDDCRMRDNNDLFPGMPDSCMQFCNETYPGRFRVPNDCVGADCCMSFDNSNPSLLKWDAVLNADNVRELVGGSPTGSPVYRFNHMNIIKKNALGPDRCFENATSMGWWKNGVDEFCSERFPYYLNCPGKHCPASCGPGPCVMPSDSATPGPCEGVGQCFDNSGAEDSWREDDVDSIVYGLDSFIRWASYNLTRDANQIRRQFTKWYPEAYLWVTDDIIGAGPGPGPYLPNPKPAGVLANWVKTMTEWRNSMKMWAEQNTQDMAKPDTICFPRNDTNPTTPCIAPLCRDSAKIPEVVECLDEQENKIQEDLTKLITCYQYCTTGTVPADTTAPVISDIIASSIISNGATINWSTDEESNSQVDYGLSPGVYTNSTPLNPSYVRQHRVVLTGLAPNTTYHYRVKSTDRSGNLATSGNQSFTTTLAGYAISVSASVVTSGDLVDVDWIAPVPHSVGDIIAIYRVGAPDTPLVFPWQPVGHEFDGNGTLTFSMATMAPGVYEFRYWASGIPATVARSNYFQLVDTTPDVTAPVISQINAVFLTNTSARISWVTNEPSTSRVSYGIDSLVYTGEVFDGALKLNHSLVISGLIPFTTYYFIVRSADGAVPVPNEASSPEQMLVAPENPYCPSPPAPDISLDPGGCTPGTTDSLYLEGAIANGDPFDGVNVLIKKFQNKLAMVEKRSEFLDSLHKQVTDVDGVIAQIDKAIGIITAFTKSSAVNELENEFKRIRSLDAEGGLPVVIYGWQSDPKPGETRGTWHIVRVDTRLPGRCNNQCGRVTPVENPAGHEGGWPWVKKYTKGLFEERGCFSLGDSFDFYASGPANTGCDDESEYHDQHGMWHCYAGGTTKARVIRYDEQKEFNFLRFANNVPLWKFIFRHPSRGGGATNEATLITELESVCSPSVGGFILNEPTDNRPCWEKANALLERGVMSTSCAEYFFHPPNFSEGVPGGFNLKFVKCDPEFVFEPLDAGPAIPH